ncbi:hypothetical protein [Haloarcula laminariae]|nr:hypothetical protein [Halomicroarcula laminariae]
MFQELKRLIRRGTRGGPLRECRRCGTTVEHATGDCPACESTDIAQYDI